MGVYTMPVSQSIFFGQHKSSILAQLLPNCKHVRLYEKRRALGFRFFYDIPEKEQVIASCKGAVKLLPTVFDGIIFTDYAIYFRNNDSPAGTTRIAYADLKDYLFAQLGECGGVFGSCASQSISIYPGSTKVNLAAAEVVAIINVIQDEVCLLDKSACLSRLNVAKSILSTAKEEHNNNSLTKLTYNLLLRMLDISEVCDEAAMILAEWVFRSCDGDFYGEYVNNLSTRISNETAEALRAVPDYFISNYIDMLHRTPSPVSCEELRKQYSSIKKTANSPYGTKYLAIQGNMAVRLCRHKDLNKILSDVRTNLGNTEADNLAKQCCAFSYRYMQSVLDCINSEKPLPSKYWDCRDGLGMTPLHYALILKDEATALSLIEHTDFNADISDFSEHHSNFGLIAMEKHLSDEIMANIIEQTKTSPEISNLEDEAEKKYEEYQALTKSVDNARRICETCEIMYRASARNNNVSDDSLEDFAYKLQEANERLEDLKEDQKQAWNDYSELRDAINQAFDDLVYMEKEHLASTVDLFKNSQNNG